MKIKVGDIFEMDQYHYAQYFQVVALKGQKQVVIREVEVEGESLIHPCKNKFQKHHHG